MVRGQWSVVLGLLAPVLICALLPAFCQADELPFVLTNAADVISLPAKRAAQSLKVSVTGVVTAADLALKGRFFMQDATGGVFVDNADGVRPEPGTIVAVTGISHPGAYAPIITAPTVQQIGTAPLPAARPVSIERLMSGAEDSQRVEIVGVVREARLDGSRLVADMVSGGYRFRVYAPAVPGRRPESLIAAEVRVRGTAAEAHNRSLRQLIAVELYVPQAEEFRVEKSEASNPWDEPADPLDSLAQYRRDNSLNRRVHVRGVVTLQRLGERLFVQDATGGLQVQSRQLISLSPGQAVEAVGFPSFDQNLPVLQDAIVKGTLAASTVVAPKPVSIEALQGGLHHSDFVSLKGKLLDRTVTQTSMQPSGEPNTQTTLVLQNSNVVFAAQADGPAEVPDSSAMPLGSVIEVSGICLTELDNDGKVKTFRILIGDPSEVRVLEKPPWLTTQRLLVILGVLCFVSLLGGAWLVMLSRKNAALSFLVREREKAQVALQEAHDQLEERVKQRTAELKFQITARKEEEVKFKAVLGERTRLAQELHDTVEQTLTGIALQLDTTAKLYQNQPDNAKDHLELARTLMSRSQVELRRSVWDLRQRASGQFDLAAALLDSARQITQATDTKVQLQTRGETQALPEVVEENLLRIGQEALTNVIKHARATKVQIELFFQPAVISLQVRDNGAGFDLDSRLTVRDGHFGLLGMSERAKRLGGNFHITSLAGEGTVVRVEIPLGGPQQNGGPASPEAPAAAATTEEVA